MEFLAVIFILVMICGVIQENLGTLGTTTFISIVIVGLALLRGKVVGMTNLQYFLYIFAFLIFMFGLLPFIYDNYKDNKKAKEIANIVKQRQSNYKEGQNPLIIGYPSIYHNQQQTRQLSTGALLYALPKEYTLKFNGRNITYKNILAVEFKLLFLNAFDEPIKILEMSTKTIIEPAELYTFSESIDKPVNYVSCVVEIKRVKFLDGTIWTNEE